MTGRRRNSDRPQKRGYRGGPRRATRLRRELRYEQKNNPGWFGTALLLGAIAGTAYVIFARPDLPGTWDEDLYARLPSGWPILTHRGQQQQLADTAKDKLDLETWPNVYDNLTPAHAEATDPLFGDVTMTIA